MFPISDSVRARGQGGFSLVEMMVVVAIVGVLMALGIPAMMNWNMANKAAGASEFYLEGFRLARQQAISHNASSRIQLTPNPDSGQYDWQVDICFPTPTVPCTNTSGIWSSPGAIAAGDPEGAAGFTSVTRYSASLPGTDVLVPSTLPAGNTTIYYTSVGWVDTTIPGRMTRLVLTPASQYAADVPVRAVAVTLAGMPAKCEPARAVSDSRACPP